MCERLVSIVGHAPVNITWTIGLFVKVLYLLDPINMLNSECQNWALGEARSPNKKNTERQGHGKQAVHLAPLEQGSGIHESEEASSFFKDKQALESVARQLTPQCQADSPSPRIGGKSCEKSTWPHAP